MIDTIVMVIENITSEHIMNYEAFNPTSRNLFEYPYYKLSRGYFKCHNNFKRKGEYFPRLTLSKRARKGGFPIGLKIEFSAPKLLYGNNFTELEESDYIRLIPMIQQKLLEMQVRVSIDELRNAMITGIHYGKNIVLEDITASLIIKIIAKMDVSKKLDLGKTDFRNEGQAIRFHTNSSEISFYDKMKDLKQAKISEKRAIEQDNSIQRDLFSKKEQKALEVLRIEARLNNRKSIKAMFIKIGIVDFNNMKLKDFFTKDIARAVLLRYWQDIVESSMSVVLLAEEDSIVVYNKLLFDGFTKNKAIKILGALSIIKENGIRTYKELDKSFYRMKKELQLVDFQSSYLYDKFQIVKLYIEDMKSLSLDDYQGRM